MQSTLFITKLVRFFDKNDILIPILNRFIHYFRLNDKFCIYFDARQALTEF